MDVMTEEETQGYVVEPPTYKLTFERRPGLVIRMASVTIAESLKLDDYMDNLGDKESVHNLLVMFSERLISWNLREQDPDRPKGEKRAVPTTLEGVHSQDSRFIFEVVANWYMALIGVNQGKDENSDDGPKQPAPEASLPMEML